MKGIIGIKGKQMSVFTKSNLCIPVTIIWIPKNFVLEKKTKEKNSYQSTKLGCIEKKINRSYNWEKKYFQKINLKPLKIIKEIRDFETSKKVSEEILISDIFKEGEYCDVTATSKGKGTQGSIKRHNFSIGPKAHGSGYHRGSGSMGAITQNRVFKNKKLPGKMGNEKVTVQNLQIIKFMKNGSYCLIKGSVPGHYKNIVIIKESVKKADKIKNVELIWNEGVAIEDLKKPPVKIEESTFKTKKKKKNKKAKQEIKDKIVTKSKEETKDVKPIQKKVEIKEETKDVKPIQEKVEIKEETKDVKPIQEKVEIKDVRPIQEKVEIKEETKDVKSIQIEEQVQAEKDITQISDKVEVNSSKDKISESDSIEKKEDDKKDSFEVKSKFFSENK